MYEKTISMQVDGLFLEADLRIPVKTESIIIFSGMSARYNTMTTRMSRHLNSAGFGTLLFDLTTGNEANNIGQQPTIKLMTQRLLAFTLWMKSHSEYHMLDLGYWGFNLGGAASLRAASELDSVIKAIITVSARTDLAASSLRNLHTPTLLVVGELDFRALELSRAAFKHMHCDKQLLVIPGTSHTLDEPDKIEIAAKNSVAWYRKYMTSNSTKEQPFHV